jgi:molybdate transport system substrate-binding protein
MFATTVSSVAMALVLAVSSPAMPQDKPDFSGEWILNRADSTLTGGADTVESGTWRIEHHDPQFRHQVSLMFRGGRPLSYEYSIRSDGSEVVNTDRGRRVALTLRWDGTALLFVTRTSAAASESTVTYRYELVAGGRRLRATESVRGTDHDQDNVWVFDRHETNADEITVLCSNGIKAVMEELTPQFERTSHHAVHVTYGVSAILKRQIDEGKAFDVAILTPPLIDDLIKAGKIASGTRTDVARSPMALAIRAGAAKPDISSTDALKRALAQSTSIAYAREGASAGFFKDLLERMGLTEVVSSKIRLTTTGADVGGAIARGEAALGVLPVSEILPLRGVEVLGTFPRDVEGYLVMTAGVASPAATRTAVKEFVTFLVSPAVLPVVHQKGMERH